MYKFSPMDHHLCPLFRSSLAVFKCFNILLLFCLLGIPWNIEDFFVFETFCLGNILTVIVRYPKLPNHSTVHTCVLSPSIFSVILIYPSRISSVRRVGSSGFFSLYEPRNDPIGFAGYPKMFSIISNIV